MSPPLVSFIVPVYKVEPYLRRCLDSVINQTYTNLEIILVDDGSPDNCPQICDEYAESDRRITVIHKKNSGLSEARNAGLDICKGDYISFVDSDDWIDEKYIETLLDIAIKEDADIVIGENKKTDGDASIAQRNLFVKSYSAREALFHLFTQNHIAYTVAWGKLYKKDCFESIRFPKGKFHEDEFTTYILFYNSKKIVYASKILYFYCQRAESIITTRHPWDVLEYLEQRYLFFKEKREMDFLPLLLPSLCWQLLCAYWNKSKDHDELHNLYLNQLRCYMKDFRHIKRPLLHYIPLAIFSYIPQLYLAYRKFSPFYIRKEF